MPKAVHQHVTAQLNKWANQGVEGHFSGDTSWIDFHLAPRAALARLVGAKPGEIAVMNSLSVNLHLLLASFYRPDSHRHMILMDDNAFPSDLHIVRSQIALHGLLPEDHLQFVHGDPLFGLYTTEAIVQRIQECGERLAVVLLPGVKHSTGQVLDIEKITQAAHEVGAYAGFDLAHSVANMPLQLDEWKVDFASWCTYKYLNSGPGGVGVVFIRQDHACDTASFRLAGWFANEKSTRFESGIPLSPIPDANGWQVSNPPVLSIAALAASLSIFDEVDLHSLRKRSLQLTAHLRELILTELGDKVRIVTPDDGDLQGCQTTFSLSNAEDSTESFVRIMADQGVIIDSRPPNLLRASLVPLYNTFDDAEQLVLTMKSSLRSTF
jgi:kynureninase